MAAKSSDWRPGPTVCRCCLTEGCYKDISTEYFWMGKREVYSEMLLETFDLTVAYAQTGGPNSNSRLICEPCISRLRDACDFKRQVVECERVFHQHLAGGSDDIEGSSETVLRSLLEKDVKQEMGTVKVEIEAKMSDDEDFGDHGASPPDDDDDDLDDQPLTKLATKVPKKETVDLMDLMDNAKPEKRKSTTKVKTTPSKKVKKKETPKPSASKAVKPPAEKKKKGSPTPIEKTKILEAKKIVPLFQVDYDRSLCRPLGTLVDFHRFKHKLKRLKTSFSPPRSVSPVSFGSASPEPERKKLKISKSKEAIADTRQNVLTVFEFSTVYPFIFGNNKVKCFICSQPYLETSALRQHMNEKHTFAPLKRLINNKSENILKVDVSEIVCKLCSATPNNLLELKYHLKEDHDKVIDPELQDNLIPMKLDGGAESYQCVICQESFLKVRLLVIHMSVHFNNYSCEICGSGFMTLRLLKKHLESHENGNFPCDRCDKVFLTSYKRSLHVRGVHLKQYPRRCPMCPERFNSNYRRSIHLQNVHNVSMRVHKCDQCGKAFTLKYHLVCHTRSVHLQERNHQCDVCHQRFSNKESLKRHMIIHTGEKNHKCEVCGMAFLRRKNLKDHLRMHDIPI